MIHYHEYRAAGPWQIHILEIDLTDSLNTLETIKAHDHLIGLERTSSMANRSDDEDHRVVAAMNGDFFGGSGITIGAQITHGTLVKRPYPRSVFALTTSKQPLIGIVGYAGQILKQDTLVYAISGINEERLEDQLVLYNHFFGVHTGTNQWGTELALQYLQPLQGINGSITAVVTSKDSLMETGSGNMDIPATLGAVLSGHGLARDFLNAAIFVGDTITIQLSLPPATSQLQELIGGTPRIIRDGSQSVEWEQESVGYGFAHDRHPRTALGISADSTRVYFFTVDGRQAGYSAGMTLYELADYMLEWGIYQGINLDGGGSTTMVVRGQIVNSPSDTGGERSVGNALMAISTAPTGPLAYLNLPWEETFTLVESQLQFPVSGTDSYYNPLPVNSDSLFWYCDPLIGSISANGVFTAGAEQGTGLVIVSQGDLADTTLVNVTDIAELSLQPDPVVLELGETQLIAAEARDAFGHILQVGAEAYTWWVSPEIASISAAGLVDAENVGNGTIEATFHNVCATVPLMIGNDEAILVDDFSTTNNYSISGSLIDLSACQFLADSSQYVSSPTSGRLDYSLTTGGTSVLYLNCNIPISGSPESVSLQVYGDNSGHWLRGEFKDADGEKFLVNFTPASPGIDWADEWQELTVILAEAGPHWGNPNAVLNFPITWTKLYLAETNDNNKDSGSIYLDNLAANYITTALDPEAGSPIDRFQLKDYFPNPFNPTIHFDFWIHEPGLLTLHLFSLDGREVDTIRQSVQSGAYLLTWTAQNLPSGVYLFQADLGQQEISGKCMLLK